MVSWLKRFNWFAQGNKMIEHYVFMLGLNEGMVSIVFGILKQLNTGEASQVSRQTLIPN
jgi:hypothetical protein